MAYAAYDPSEAWTVDIPTNVFTVLNSTTITANSMHVKDDNAWLMFETQSTFGGSQTKTRFKLNIASWASGMATGLCLFSTKVGSRDAQKDYAGADLDSVGITVIASGSAPQFRIDEHTGGTIATQAFTGTLSTSTEYFVEMDWNPALGANGRITVSIWTSSYGGVLVESQTLDVSGAHSAYSYFYPMCGNHDDGAGGVSGTFTITDPEQDGVTGIVDSSQAPRNQQGNVQDHTTYTQVDGGAIAWTTAANQLDGLGDEHREDSYSHKVTPQSMAEDFSAFMKVTPTSVSGGWRGWFMGLSDTVGSLQDVIDASGNCIAVGLEATSTTVFRIRADSVDAGTQTATNGTGGLAENKAWWIKLAFDYDGATNGQMVVTACEDHPDSVRTSDAATHNLAAQRTYTKMQGFMSLGNSGATSQTADFTSSDLFFSFDADILQTVTTAVEFTQTVDRELTTVIDSIKIKHPFGGPSTIRLAPSRIWVVAVDDSAGSTHALYTDTEGLSWTSTVLTNSYAASSHCIGEGADGEPVVVVRQGTAAKFDVWKYNGSTWALQSTVSNKASATTHTASIGFAYDGTTYHLVTANQDSLGKDIVEHRTSTDLITWSSPTVVETGLSGGLYKTGAQRSLAMCVDRSSNLHLAYTMFYSTVSKMRTRYSTWTGSAWSAPETVHDYGTASSSTKFLVGLDIAADINDKPHLVGIVSALSHLSSPTGFTGGVTDRVPFYFERTGGSWTTAEVIEDSTASVKECHYPTLHMNNGTTPIVYWGASIGSGNQLRRGERGGSWVRSNIGAQDDYAAYNLVAPDAAQYARTNVGQVVNGTFMYLRGSLEMFVSTGITWQDESDPVSEGATMSHTIHMLGRDKVADSPSFAQVVAFNRGYTFSVPTAAAFAQSVGLARAYGRTVTAGVPFPQQIDLHYVPTGGGGDDIWDGYQENRLAFETSVALLAVRNLGSTDTLSMSQEINLTLGRTVPQTVDFEQVISKTLVKLLTVDQTPLFSQVVFLNKILNLTVTHGIVFTSSGLPIRDWSAYSTHYDALSGIDLLEDTTTQVVFMAPASLPTQSLTLMQPAFGDRRVDFRRRGAVRRNRTGQARVFATPVYSRFELVWQGIPRVIAEEFRHRIVEWVGIELLYQDHNGVQHKCVITDVEIPREQGGLEHVTLNLTLEKVGRIDVTPTTAG